MTAPHKFEIGECDVMVAWDSGVRTPAVSADLTRDPR